MSKSNHFFGQSVFGQLVSLFDRVDISRAVKNHGSDYHCKGFSTWDHLVTMLFSSLANCNSLREIAAGFLGLKGKTEHLGLGKLPKRSTLSDANKHRTPLVFEEIYKKLLVQHRDSISDSRLKNKFKKEVNIIDSTSITLFKDILKSVGRKPKSGKEKGGIKVHTVLNADEQVPNLVWFSDASKNDIIFWEQINFKPGSLYVFDKGYVDHWRYDKLTKDDVFFVTRLKDNACYEELEELEIDDKVDPGVMRDQWIELPLRENGKIKGYTRVRRIAYWDDENQRSFEFISNLAEIDPGQIAELYKTRWKIELLFKQLKQNFPLKYFLGDNENAIVIQIWCSMIANLLLTIIKSKLKRGWSFSSLVSFARIHLFNYIHLINFLENPEKDWENSEIFTAPTLFSG